MHAELERFFTGCWGRARLGKKTDAISRLAHDMDLPVKAARNTKRSRGSDKKVSVALRNTNPPFDLAAFKAEVETFASAIAATIDGA